MNLREALKNLFGQTGATEEQIRQELHQLKIEGLLDSLMQEGHLAADPATQDLARRFAAADPDGFGQLMRTPRPVPAQTQTITPPGPPASDPTDAQIQQIAAEKGLPYHAAAVEASRGGALQG